MIISTGILKPPVGHLRGEQIFSERNFFLSASASPREELWDGSNDRLVDQKPEAVEANQDRAAFVANDPHWEREVDAEGGD